MLHLNCKEQNNTIQASNDMGVLIIMQCCTKLSNISSFSFHSDVDECNASSPVCDLNAKCNNTIGSYRCTCNTGYHGDGKSCQGKRK